MEAGAPGMLSRMAEMEPPATAAQARQEAAQARQDALTQAKYTGKQQNGNAGHKTAASPASNGVYFIEMEEPGYRPETGIIGQR